MAERSIEERDQVNETASHASVLSELPRDQLQRSGRYLPPPPQMSPPPPMRPSLPSVAPRQRAAIACLNCRKRKVRCCGRDSSEGSRCTTCARTSRQCVFVAVRNEAFASAYTMDTGLRQQQSRSLRSPPWQSKSSYPYPYVQQQVVRDDKSWSQRQPATNDWRTTDDRFHRSVEGRDSYRSALPSSQIGERPKLSSDRSSYGFEHSLTKPPRTAQLYQNSIQDSYLPGPWIGVHPFQGYGPHSQAPAMLAPPAFLPSVPSLNTIPPGPYPGPYNGSWQHVKMESALKSA